MSIFKDTFRDYVRDQLELREELISIGNPDLGDGNRRHLSHTFHGRNGEVTLKPGAHHTYTLNKQCVIRMTSLVDYVTDVGLDIGDLGGQSFNALKGASLSQNFILQGGTLSNKSNIVYTSNIGKDGKPITERRVERNNQVRSSFPKPGLETNIAYGDFAIGADASEDGYGIVPMPGIIDASIRTKSAYGSLREGKINFEVHNQRQLEIMEMLYMRPGYMVLLEWGWCPYIASSGNTKGNIVNELRLVENETNDDIYTNNITQNRVYNAINNLKESQDGNYDGMLGFVKNFGFQAREDGGYSCFTELTSMGEVIESLKIPSVSIINTTKDIENNNSPTTTDDGGEIIIVQGERLSADEYAASNAPFSSQLSTSNSSILFGGDEDATDVDRDVFDRAIATHLFPSFNGLLGLINVINNYTLFGFGKTDEDQALENINRVFDFNTKIDYNSVDTHETFSATTANSDLDPKEQLLVNDKIKTLKGFVGENDPLGLSKRYSFEEEVTTLLGNLLAFQSADFETLLLNKFQLQTVDELKNYIIPTYFNPPTLSQSATTLLTATNQTAFGIASGVANFSTLGLTSGPTDALGQFLGVGGDEVDEVKFSDTFKADTLKQSYIRWDTLATLINDYLIPKSENGETPLKIVTDRVYDIDKNTSRLDPLLFCPITSYKGDTEEDTNDELFDFSCDSNICILPLQFDSDLDVISETLGYTPDTSIFPVNLITSMYGYNESNASKDILYDGSSIYFSGVGPTQSGKSFNGKLNDNDKLRRIGSIFLNIPMLLSIAEKNADNDNYSVGNFIKDIWDEVNKVCPNHNFVLTDDKESNNIFIIDLPVDNSVVPMDLHTFIPFSNKNILRNFDYTSNVPNAMTSTIAIQAQDPRSIQDIDGVTFAAFNRSIKNRILSKDIKSTYEKAQEDIQNQASKINAQQANLLSELETYNENFFINIKQADNDKEIIGEGNIIGILKTYQKNAAYLTTANFEYPNTFNSVIPLEFSATLDGISGMVIGNIFKIQKDRLPRAYHKSNIGFILFNEEQKITAGGDWTTDISGKMTILPSEKVLKLNKTFKFDVLATPVDLTKEIEDSNNAFVAESTGVVIASDAELSALEKTLTAKELISTQEDALKALGYPDEVIAKIQLEALLDSDATGDAAVLRDKIINDSIEYIPPQ